MTNLLERCRTAGPDEAKSLLMESYRAIFPPRTALPQGSDERDAAYWRDENFYALIAINTEPAFIGAALMLADTVKNRGPIEMVWHGSGQAFITSADACRGNLGECVYASCLSLAILAAVLAAQTPVSIAEIGDDEEVGR